MVGRGMGVCGGVHFVTAAPASLQLAGQRGPALPAELPAARSGWWGLSPIPPLQAGAAGEGSCCVWAGGRGWAPGAEPAPRGGAPRGRCCRHPGDCPVPGGAEGFPPLTGMGTGNRAAASPPAAGIASSSTGIKGVRVVLDPEAPWPPLAAGRARNPFYILLETFYNPGFQVFRS